MNKSISISVLLISNLIIQGSFAHMNFFSNAMPIEYNKDMSNNNDISDGNSSSSTYNNNYRAMLDGHQLQRSSSIFDKYDCNYHNDHNKYTTTNAKILHQIGQTQSFFEQTAVGSCAEEVMQSSPNWVGEKAAMQLTGQPSAVSNLTNNVITTPTYFVWVDGEANSDILFKANSTSPTINLSNNTGRSDFPQISSSQEGNNVYVVWQDTTTTSGTHDIFFAASNDSGQTFSDVKNLSNNEGTSTSPQIYLSGNNVYVVWKDDTPGNSDIFFAASNDKGQSFSEAKNLSTNDGTSISSQISSSGNNVYVVWEDTTSGNRDIFFAASNDNGQTFSDVKNLSDNQRTSDFPEISSSGNNVYVVWQDFTPGNRDILFAASNDKGQTFSEAKNLSINEGTSTSPQISLSRDNVYVVWTDNTLANNSDILFAASNDKGQTFSEAKNLSINEGTSTSPQISSSVNNVYVVWQDTTPGNRDILFAASTDGGQTFSAPENLSTNSGESFRPQISSSVNNVYVVWEDTTPGNRDILFAASTDGGQTFSAPENLSTNSGESFRPQISSSGNNVYVVWQDSVSGFIVILFKAGTESGQTFSEAKNLSTNGRFFHFNSPQIASSGNDVYVVWGSTPPGIPEIFFAVSKDNGQTFSAAKNLSNNGGRSILPQISLSGNDVYVVWRDETPGNSDIFFAASNDSGQTFSAAKNLSNNGGGSVSPQISSSGNNVYVVWQDNTPGNIDIFFARSTDNGQTFTQPENLSTNGGTSTSPQISSSGNNVYVVWEDSTPGNSDIFFAASNDSGQTFSTAKNLSNNAGESRKAQISSSGNNVYVVWQDSTPGNSDIFFAASNDSGQTFSIKNFSANPTSSGLPQISLSGNKVYVVWTQGTSSNSADIFFAASNDNGQTFSAPKNLSNNTGISNLPQISSSGNNVYVVWEDSISGLRDIFFAASNDSGQTFSAPENLSNNAGASFLPEISIRK